MTTTSARSIKIIARKVAIVAIAAQKRKKISS
jgi:hypothetical protein